jgi:hypothetical protein
VRRRLIVLALAGLATPALAHAATGAQVAADLSRERVAQGIPGGLTEDPVWSRRCEKHVHWMQQNGKLQHGEDPGTPGYSADGDMAGKNAVLSSGTVVDFNRVNPYLTAPYHLLQLYAPELQTIGSFEAGGYGCHTTFPGFTRPAPAADTFDSYPGDGAKVPWFELAHESPSVPGDEVGLPQGRITGTNMMVYWRGPDAAVPLNDIVSATLKDADGHGVDVRTVGNQQNDLVLLGSGFVIPVRPLKPGSAYSATATLSSDDPDHPRELTYSWSFRTTALPSPKKAVGVKLKSSKRKGLVITLVGKDVYAGRTASVTIDYGKRFSSKLHTKAPLGVAIQATPVPKGGSVKVTAKVKAFSVGGVKVPGTTVVKRLRG